MMEYFKAINDYSRATYYVLPLIYLNKFSFGPPTNFVNAYVTSDGTKAVVRVVEPDKVSATVWMSEHFIAEQGDVIFFNIPFIHRKAVMKYMEGKYSEMGEIAHASIRGYSGLDYKKDRRTTDGRIVSDTDARLLALEKHPDLRERLEALLSYAPIRYTCVIDSNSELMSPPTKEEIWYGEIPALKQL